MGLGRGQIERPRGAQRGLSNLSTGFRSGGEGGPRRSWCLINAAGRRRFLGHAAAEWYQEVAGLPGCYRSGRVSADCVENGDVLDAVMFSRRQRRTQGFPVWSRMERRSRKRSGSGLSGEAIINCAPPCETSFSVQPSHGDPSHRSIQTGTAIDMSFRCVLRFSIGIPN